MELLSVTALEYLQTVFLALKQNISFILDKKTLSSTELKVSHIVILVYCFNNLLSGVEYQAHHGIISSSIFSASSRYKVKK